MRKLIFISVLILFQPFTNLIAQTQVQTKMDSLKGELNKYKEFCLPPCLKDSSKVNLLNALAWEFKFITPDSAIAYGNEALKLSEKINWQSGIARSYHQIASIYYNKGDYYISLKYYTNALKIWEGLEKTSPEQKADILNRKSKTLGNMGNVYSSLNNYSSALDCYLKALKIDEAMGNQEGIGNKLGQLGVFYQHEKNYPKSIEYYTRSLEIFEKLKNKNKIAISLGNLGLIYSNSGDTVKALSYYNQALLINRETGNKKNIASNLGNIAIIMDHQKKYSLALTYYLESLNLHTQLGDQGGTALIIGNIGSCYLDQKKYTEAEKYLLNAIVLSEKVHDLETEHDNQINLTNLYEKTDNHKKALDHYKKAMALKDSLFNKEKTEEIVRKEMNYGFDMKETIAKAEQERKEAAQNAQLEKQKLITYSMASGAGLILLSSLFSFFFYKRKRDAEQKQKETFLNLQVSETEMKALRSQMNPHFIFNALQSIQTFLISHKPDDANTYLLKFSKLMRLVLENSQHSEVPLKEDIEALELYMQLESIRLQHPFTYQFHIDKSVNTENDSIPPLILQPFVENAIWHGLQYKSESGHIDIYISKKDNALCATVEDNGIGRDMNQRIAQPMLLKKESLGMKLTEERLKVLNELKKIKAQFKITDLFTNDNQPAGTKVELSLPLVA